MDADDLTIASRPSDLPLREWLNFGPGDQMEAHCKMIQDVVVNEIHWKGECVSAVCRVR